MAVIILDRTKPFPPMDSIDESGLVAVGGSLTLKRLVEAYSKGIFPWYSEGEPVLWWSPDPRVVLFPEELHVSKSMKRELNRKKFSVTVDKEFEKVMLYCRETRADKEGSWITNDMIEAYKEFHYAGYAHSVEVWDGGKLVGGFYGVSMGKIFFGESMFYLKKNASKFGFIKFVLNLKKLGFRLIDCQVDTDHLKSFGAREISRDYFLNEIKDEIENTAKIFTVFPDFF
ncbi:MAG: leucyl/phenylalanyl-tRNA--protein transferase [Acidobacteriota bacterium]